MSLKEVLIEPDRMVIYMNDSLGKRWSRGKYAAHAVHAALKAMGVHPGVPVVVLGAKPRDILTRWTTVHDEGRTELEPGTLTSGTDYNIPYNIGEKLMAERRKHRIWVYHPEWYWDGWRSLIPFYMSHDEYARRTLVIGWNCSGRVIIPLWACDDPWCTLDAMKSISDYEIERFIPEG